MTLRSLIDSGSSCYENKVLDLTVSQLLDLEIEVFDCVKLKKIVACSCYHVVDCSGDVVTKLQLFL